MAALPVSLRYFLAVVTFSVSPPFGSGRQIPPPLVLLLVPNTGTFVLLLMLASGRSALQPKAQKTDASKEGKFTCVYIPHLVEESRFVDGLANIVL